METAATQATTEAVAIVSTLNPVQEEVQMVTDVNTDEVTNDSNKPDAVVSVQALQTEPEHIINLKKAFNIAINNPGFVKDQKKVEMLTESLALVDPETRVRAQLETNAYKTLRAKAAKRAEEPGGVYLAPTQLEIDAYIEAGLQVWRDKQK